MSTRTESYRSQLDFIRDRIADDIKRELRKTGGSAPTGGMRTADGRTWLGVAVGRDGVVRAVGRGGHDEPLESAMDVTETLEVLERLQGVWRENP